MPRSLLKPAASFDEPLELLAACHERIHDRLSTLERLVPHLASHGCSPDARAAAANILRYFNTAAVHHHEDEEHDLFPALLAAAPAEGRAALQETIARLLDEHQRMFAAWAALRSDLEAIQAGSADTLNAETVTAFCSLYRDHIRFEESNAFAPAAVLLDEETRARLGKNMAGRRGVQIQAN